MKKIISMIVFMLCTSSFASECRIHFRGLVLGDDTPSILTLISKLSRNIKKQGVTVVTDESSANVGLSIYYKYIQRRSSVSRGPYGDETVTEFDLGVRVVEYRDGSIIGSNVYRDTDASELASKILADIGCI